MAERKRATSADVAREAGVSRTTVSFVLNATSGSNISSDTRRRVLDAAARLGYTPSAAARSLRRGHSDVVLCLLPDWPIHTAAGDYLEQLSIAFGDSGLAFVVHPRAESTPPLTEIWKRIRPAVVLTFDRLTAQDQADTDRVGIPVVVVALIESETHTNVGAYANEVLGRLQAQHLVDKDHQRIGYAYPGNRDLDYFAAARLLGVRQVVARAALQDPVVIPVSLTTASATTAVERWRRADPPVTGVCAYNDEVAIALLSALHAMDLAAPHDLAVIGVDDVPVAELVVPPLTTVRRSMADMARQTVRAVLQRLDRTPPTWWSAPRSAEVVERSST